MQNPTPSVLSSVNEPSVSEILYIVAVKEPFYTLPKLLLVSGITKVLSALIDPEPKTSS
jgi:hypothetical protein